MGKYFTVKELSHTFQPIDNTPTKEIEINLQYLIENLLNAIREAWGKPIKVNSGYRCPALNKKVGGAATSQHMKGEAADITTGSPECNRQLFELIQTLNIPFDQLIDEKKYTWLHVSLKKAAGNRKQILHLK